MTADCQLGDHDRDSIRLGVHVYWTKLDHLIQDIMGVIDVQCNNRVVALTLSISCRFALGIVALQGRSGT